MESDPFKYGALFPGYSSLGPAPSTPSSLSQQQHQQQQQHQAQQQQQPQSSSSSASAQQQHLHQQQGYYPQNSGVAAHQMHQQQNVQYQQQQQQLYVPSSSSLHQTNGGESGSDESDDDEHAARARAPVCKISKADWTRIYKHIGKWELWNKPSATFNALGELGVKVNMKPKAFQAQWNTRRVRLEQFATIYLQERKRLGPSWPHYNDISLKTLKCFPQLNGIMKKFDDPEAALALGLLMIQKRKSTEPSASADDVGEMNAAAAAAANQMAKKLGRDEPRSPSQKPKKDKKEKRDKKRKKSKQASSFPDDFGSIDSGSVEDELIPSLSPRKRSKSKSGSKKKKARKSKSSIDFSDNDVSSLDSERSSSDSAGFSSSKTDLLIGMIHNLNDKFDKLTAAIQALVNQPK